MAVPITPTYISIHALLAESDFRYVSHMGSFAKISIHALLAESDLVQRHISEVGGISIHALLAESDMLWPVHLARGLDFYPRSPCGERRDCFQFCFFHDIFLSTLSLRRATAPCAGGVGGSRDFYPRSPCGERPCAAALRLYNTDISIHALLAESDPIRNAEAVSKYIIFLSTLSLRRATNGHG